MFKLFKHRKTRNNNQRGFTLIEIIITLAIASFIVVLIGMAFAQTMIITSKSQDHMLVIRQLQTAGYWVSRDSQMAKNAIWQEPVEEPFPLQWQLTINWEDITANTYEAVYVITEEGKFVRYYYRNSVLQETRIIAEGIVSDPAQTYYDTSVAYGAEFRIAATIGGITESRDYNVLSRLYVP
jgi:prepilin-type N-terminal cleavage/methylation domain-containing protein